MRTLLFSPVLLLSIASVGFSQITSGAWIYTLSSSGEATITGYIGPGGVVTVPAVLNGYPVKKFGGGAEPVFGFGIRAISVSDVVITGGVEQIGDNAFRYATSLNSLSIPGSVTVIGAEAFFGCSLKDLTIPNSVVTVGDGAFGSSGLISVDLPAGLTEIGNDLFSQSSITKLAIPGGVTNVGHDAFNLCAGLTNLIIPSKVQSIGIQAFAGCTSLTNVTFGSGVRCIFVSAFAGCSGLTNVSIPASVTNISWTAFASCTSLTNFSVDSSNANYQSLGGIVFNKLATELVAYPAGRAGPYAIPSGVTNVQGGAFAGCTKLSDVVIPGSVRIIEPDAFGYCLSLTNLYIPDSVTSIGSGAFAGSSALTNVLIGNSVTNIGELAFRQCTDLKSVHFRGNKPAAQTTTETSSTPAGTTTVTNYIFDSITPVGTVYYRAGTTGWGPIFQGWPTQSYGGTKSQTATFKLPSKMVYDGSYALRATFSCKGSVTYSVNDGTVAQVSGNQLKILKADAPFSVTARQAGDTTWAAAEVQAGGTAAKKPQRIAFTVRSSAIVGQTLPLSVTVNSSLAVTVTSSDSGIVRINNDGTATALAKGRAVLTAVQNGDPNHGPAKPVQKTVSVR